MSSTAPMPWEPRPDESAPAYAAFLAYRDMGPSRTVLGAYRQERGKDGAKQASGNWNEMASVHQWESRAKAWDGHQARIFAKEAEKTIRSQARDWAKSRGVVIEKAVALGLKLMDKANTLADFPVSEQTVSKDGQKITINPVDPADLRHVAIVGKEGYAMALAACDAGIAGEASAQRSMDPDSLDAAKDEAAAGLDRWRAEQRAKILAMPSVAPPAGG